MTGPRNVPLIERKADARDLAEKMRKHKQDCRSCGIAKCGAYQLMAGQLRKIRAEIAHWFDPPADAPVLFR